MASLVALAAAGANVTTPLVPPPVPLVPNFSLPTKTAVPSLPFNPTIAVDPKTAAPSLPFNPLVGMGTAVDPLASPLQLPKELDEKVTEWLDSCGTVGGCDDIHPELSSFRYFATELIERQAARMWGT